MAKKIWFFIIIVLFIICEVSCSSKNKSQEYVDQGTISISEPINYENWKTSDVMEGKYSRNDFCSVSFSYQYRTLGLLTVAIGNNFSKSVEVDEIYEKLFYYFNELLISSPVAFEIPITIYVIPESAIENCLSNNAIVFTSPERLDNITLLENIIGAATGISEYWVKAGAAYIASGEEVNNQVLKNWYQETKDLNMLGLFIARFSTDWVSQQEVAIARMTAASLITYCVEVENIPVESIEGKINNDLRNRWLKYLGIQRTVDYTHDGFYNTFQFSQSDTCQLEIQTDIIHFCLNKLEGQVYFDTIDEVEDFIFRAYSGYNALTEFLVTNAPSITPLINPENEIFIEVRELDVMLGYTEGNTIRIQNSAILFDVLPEIVHTYNWNKKLAFVNDNLLLAEGFAEYLGKLLPIYEQTITEAIWEDINGRQSSPGISYWYYLDEEQMSAAIEWYLKQGGSINSVSVIDARLFTDAVAFATIYRMPHGGSMGISIYEKYNRLRPKLDLTKMDGLELNYSQAASYVAWLCDTYSLDTVLEKYVNNNDSTAIRDKSYEELKLEWLTELVANGGGIHIPESP